MQVLDRCWLPVRFGFWDLIRSTIAFVSHEVKSETNKLAFWKRVLYVQYGDTSFRAVDHCIVYSPFDGRCMLISLLLRTWGVFQVKIDFFLPVKSEDRSLLKLVFHRNQGHVRTKDSLERRYFPRFHRFPVLCMWLPIHDSGTS